VQQFLIMRVSMLLLFDVQHKFVLVLVLINIINSSIDD
jgi:hypothetical protein